MEGRDPEAKRKRRESFARLRVTGGFVGHQGRAENISKGSSFGSGWMSIDDGKE